MSSLLKSAVLGASMLVALGATASAQSVANLPPTSQAAPPAPVMGAPVASSLKGVQPDPGSLGAWKHEAQLPADYATNANLHPYSSGVGPKAN